MSPRCLNIASAAVLFATLTQAQSMLHSENNLLGIDDGAITPDRRYGVVRENSIAATARAYDMVSGAPLASSSSISTPWWSGAAQDAVELTNTRAVVLGNTVQILDLTTLPASLTKLSDTIVGSAPRDVAITPDGDLAIVRGGNTFGGFPGGSFVFRLGDGQLLGSRPGEMGDPLSSTQLYAVDSVVTNDDCAACLSLVGSGTGSRTRVSVWKLHPGPAALPVIGYETSGGSGADQDQLGAPHDISLSPDRRFAAVRSESAVGLYDLSAAAGGARLWLKRLYGEPGPMGNTSMDSVEWSAQRVATASRWSNAQGQGAQIDVFDLAGLHWYARISGDPHDLTLSPDGMRLFVRTSSKLVLFDLANLPAPGVTAGLLVPAAEALLNSTHTFYGAGYDSVVATNERVYALARSGSTTQVRAYRHAAAALQPEWSGTLPEKPVDLQLTPDAEWLVVSGTSRLQVYDTRSGTLALQHDPAPETAGWYPWCDGVAVNGTRALAFGYSGAQSGWVSVLSLFPESVITCTASPNSSGEKARISAQGSPRVTDNRLTLLCNGLPSPSIGYFTYGTAQSATPFGNGTLCIGGTVQAMPAQSISGALTSFTADFTQGPSLGGLIQPGQTWYFQLRYRDDAAGTGQFNTSDALGIDFR